MRIHTMLP